MGLTKLVRGTSTAGDIFDNVNGLIDRVDPLSSFVYVEDAPDGFVWPNDLPIPTASNIGGKYQCSVKPYDILNPANITKVYYVDPIYGLNTNAGSWANLPVQSIWKAIELMKTQSAGLGARIMLKGGFYPIEHGFLNADATLDLQSRPISFEAQHGRAVISLSTKMVFTKSGSHTYVYTSSMASALMAFNPSVKSHDGYTHTKYKCVFSIQAVEDTNGSFFFDTTTSTCYLHPHGNEAATNENVRVILAKKQISTINSYSIFMQGVDLEGGSLGYFYEPSDNKRVGAFVAVDSSFRYNLGGTFDTPTTWGATSNANFSITAFFDCDISRCSRDALSSAKAAAAQNCSLLAVNCTGLNNGLLTEDYPVSVKPSSCNGFTLHNGLSAIDIGGVYTGSAGSNVAIVHEDTQAWCFGTIAGDSDGDKINGKSITVGGFSVADTNAKLWLDSCVVKGAYSALFASGGGTIYKRRTQYSGTLTGTVTDY